VIESRADEMVGPVSMDEYKALVSHLSGVRQNRVFHALGLSASRGLAKVKLAEGQGAALLATDDLVTGCLLLEPRLVCLYETSTQPRTATRPSRLPTVESIRRT